VGPSSAAELLEEAARTPFRGWDFSWLGGRLVVEPPPWSFEDIVEDAASTAESMLDMGTGGGEWLSSLRHRPGRRFATESWAPNTPIAAAQLRPLDIAVVQDEGAVNNVQQRPGKTRGRLAFRGGAFDLVVSRHEAFVAAEVHRVLRSGGTFVTQQASSGSRQFHELLGLEPPTVEEFGLELAAEQVEATGFLVRQAQVGIATTVFADIGALAWYLAAVPWAVPAFSIDVSRNALMKLHGEPIPVPSERFWLRARA
jgi:SAM-dependent methyltransferase